MRWLLVLLAALVLAPAASPARVPRACSLLTSAQVAKALGAKPEWHEARGDGRSQLCMWHAPTISAATGVHPQLQLMVYPVTKARFKAGENQTMTARPAKGVGEVAYFSGPEGDFLTAWSDGYAVQVSVFYVVSPQAKAKQAANSAIANL